MKAFSPACERNRQPILEALAQILNQPALVLEIASGTGQHAVWFARHLGHLTWQPSDLAEQINSIHTWRMEEGSPNLQPPLVLDVCQFPWPLESADAIFTANSLHILSWPAVQLLFAGCGKLLAPGKLLCTYGPFHLHGQATSPGNALFDQLLREEDPSSGIRDLDELIPLALQNGLTLASDRAMPANNRLLLWEKQADV